MSNLIPPPDPETAPPLVPEQAGLVHSDLPSVPSPYEGKAITVRQHFSISAYWFATNFLWGAMLTVMIPDEVKHIAPLLKGPGVSLVQGAGAIFALIVPLVAGALSDRCANKLGRRRPFLIGGVAINIVGLLLMAFAYRSATPVVTHGMGVLLSNSGFLLFFLAYAVVQFGNNVATAAYSGIIPDLVPHEQRGAASGWMALQSQMGTLFGALGCGLLLAHQPEMVKYFALCVVIAGVSLITLTGIKENPLPYKPKPIAWGEYFRSLWIDPKKHPDFAWVWITRALVMLGFYAILPYVNYYLGDIIQVPNVDEAFSKVLGLVLLASSLSGIYGGVLSDRIGRKRVVYIANSVIALMVLGFIFCHNLEQVFAVGLLFGLGYGAYTSVDWALGTDVLPSKADAGKEMAVWHIAMTLPQTLASSVGGFLLAGFGMKEVQEKGELVSHYNLGGYAALFVVSAACFALGAYFLKNVKGVS